MRQDLSLSKNITINASPSKVWEVLTTPELIKEFLYGTETITDWKVGSEIIFQGEYNGHSYRDHGKIVENIPNEKLTYSYWSGFSGLEDSPENYMTITYSFSLLDNGNTDFTWSQKGFASEEGLNHSKEGMDALLNQIKIIAER